VRTATATTTECPTASTTAPKTRRRRSPASAAAGSQLDLDTDEDTVFDCDDNCPEDANTDQEDTEPDGLGNVCDPTPAPEPTAGWLSIAALVTLTALRRRRK
jgi:MYXO-CTERM domain-containing protein